VAAAVTAIVIAVVAVEEDVLVAAQEATVVATRAAVVAAAEGKYSVETGLAPSRTTTELERAAAMRPFSISCAVTQIVTQNDKRLKMLSGICWTAAMTYRQTFGV
jgi:hypothetical protein